MEKNDSKLTVSIILTITLIFIGIGTILYFRYQDKVRMSKQEDVLKQLEENRQRLNNKQIVPQKYEEYEGKG